MIRYNKSSMWEITAFIMVDFCLKLILWNLDDKKLKYRSIYRVGNSWKNVWNRVGGVGQLSAKVGEDLVCQLLFFRLQSPWQTPWPHEKRHECNMVRICVLNSMSNTMSAECQPFWLFFCAYVAPWLPHHGKHHGECHECRNLLFSLFFTIFARISRTNAPS